MSATDEYLRNNAAYTEGFAGPLPLPPSQHLAVVACMDARLNVYDDAFKASIQQETGIKPEWAVETFTDLDDDVRQSIARIKASPFVPHKDHIRGFVFDVATGKLNEVF